MDLKRIKENVNEFLLINQSRYEILSNFQDYLSNLSSDNLKDTIHFIENHSNFFFNNHSSAIFFFFNILRTSQFNFKIFELYLNLCIIFKSQLEASGTTENELLIICIEFPNSINYFFGQNFFNIQSIIELSTIYIDLFINFLPEIEYYDHEYANLRVKSILSNQNFQHEISLYEFVRANPKKHILYRNLNYHPSLLHKSIRDDDYETFQKILSRNNYSINHKIEYSRYERSKTIEKELSLIQIAAIYGSLIIFKFLWFQKRININKNLLSYAYYGSNYEIIHLCEQRCSYHHVYIQPFLFHHNDLLNYYIENYGNNIHENNQAIKNILMNYEEENDDEDDLYQILNSDYLKNAIYSFNFEIIKSCLQKIVFILNKIELNIDLNYKYDSFLKSSKFDVELFKFFYNQVMISHNYEFDQRVNILFNLMRYCGNDSFKLVFDDEQSKKNVLFLLRNSIKMNHDVANFVLDKINNCNGIINIDEIDVNDLLSAVQYYNENIIVKFVVIKDFFTENENIQKFISHLLNYASPKMINSLFLKLSMILQKSVLTQMEDHLKSAGGLKL